jgi:oxygen-dependent protoporphyrinogen oxidase
LSRIAVIGGGIAGLTAAHRLMAEHDVVVFEREATPGGKVRSQQIDEYLFEWGPGGFLSSADDVRALVREVGLDDALLEAGPAAKNRYIFWNGRLHQLPARPQAFFALSLLSATGKARAFGELFVQRRAGGDGDADAPDESVSAFMTRRFGAEVAERIVAPALLGVSGGDAATTSIAAVFPRVPAFERERGSVIRGMIASARKGTHMMSLRDGGMQRLTDRIAERLGTRLRLGSAVERIERSGGGWQLTTAGGETLVDGVIIATPSDAAAALVNAFDAELAADLGRITYAPMRAIGVAFRATDMPAPLDGFGFLAARGSGIRILGATYTSAIMPEQAAPNTAYLRVFMGGSTDADAIALDAAQARAIVLRDLATVLGVHAEPVAYHEALWPRAIPQYGLRHRAIVRAIGERAAQHPRLAFTGNAFRGLGVSDTVTDARAVAAAFG